MSTTPNLSHDQDCLLAAAPEMLAALHAALPLLQDHQNMCRSVPAAGLYLRIKAILDTLPPPAATANVAACETEVE